MIPKYLFHYTSIETAKKILQSHKIRFTRLDLLNDPYEGDFAFPDLPVAQSEKRKLVYCSCWNSDDIESVNLWHIYTDMRGVRLKMKSSMFSKRMVLEEQPSGFAPASEITPLSSLYNMLDKKISKVYGPLKIAYVSRFEDTYETVIGKSVANSGTEKEFKIYDINLKELGIKKVKHWQFESEWRYKACPYIEIHGSEIVMTTPLEIETPNYIDIPFVEEIEEILLAPQAREEEIDDLNRFIEANGINVQINRSCIQYRSKTLTTC